MDETRGGGARRGGAHRHPACGSLLALLLAACSSDAPGSGRPGPATTVGATAEQEATPGGGPTADSSAEVPTPSMTWRKVSPDVVATLEADGEVPVLVSLDADDDPERIATVREAVLDRVGDTGFHVRTVFDRVPAVAGLVLTTDALVALEQDPHVVAVAIDAGGSGGGVG